LLEGPERNLKVLRIRGRPLTRDVGIAAPDVWRVPKVLDTLLTLIKKQFEEVKPLIHQVFRGKATTDGISASVSASGGAKLPDRP
jgi:hypothetical protein